MAPVALVVEDDPVSRLVLGHMLRANDFVVDFAMDTVDAFVRIDTVPYDLVVSDFHLPSGTGIDVLEGVEDSPHPAPFVLITGILEYASLPPELTARLADHLTKPVSSATLQSVLDRLFPPAGE
jgi:CheY-like chemotaxis protein